MNPPVERFEDLIAWQKARDLWVAVVGMTRSGDAHADFAFRGQIRRSALSVMANIAEGFDRGGRAEFAQFASIAKGSCAEVRSHLHAASAAGYIGDSEYRQLLDHAEELSRILGGLRSSLAAQRDQLREQQRAGTSRDARH